MRALTIAALSLAAACGSKPGADQAAATSGNGSAADSAAGSLSAAGGNSFTAEVVDVDAKAGTITLRSPSASATGASSALRRLSVAGTAKSQLSSVKEGDQVVVACDDAGGPAGTPDGEGPVVAGPRAGAGGAGEPGQPAPTDGGSVSGRAGASAGAARAERPATSGPD